MSGDRRKAPPRRLALLLAAALLGACGGGGGGGAAPVVPPSVPPPPSTPPAETAGSKVTATFTISVTGIDVERPSNGESVYITINNVWNEHLELAE